MVRLRVVPSALLSASLVVACASGCSGAGTAVPTPRGSASAPATEGSTTASAGAADLPPLEELVIRPDGLGTLVVGSSPAASTMVSYDSDACLVEDDPLVMTPGDPAAGRWISAYPEEGEDEAPFTVAVAVDRLLAIAIESPALATAEGIHLGSTLAELMTAYPDLETVYEDDQSSVHTVTRAEGRLSFEVLGSADHAPYRRGEVFLIEVHDLSFPTGVPTVSDDSLLGTCV